MSNSVQSLVSTRIEYLAAKAYQMQVHCWYKEKIDSLISLNELLTFGEATLLRRIHHWSALLG